MCRTVTANGEAALARLSGRPCSIGAVLETCALEVITVVLPLLPGAVNDALPCASMIHQG
jgi:hypothetical protein